MRSLNDEKGSSSLARSHPSDKGVGKDPASCGPMPSSRIGFSLRVQTLHQKESLPSHDAKRKRALPLLDETLDLILRRILVCFMRQNVLCFGLLRTFLVIRYRRYPPTWKSLS